MPSTTADPTSEAMPAAPETDLDRVAAFFDDFSKESQRWRRRNRTYYRLIESITGFLVPKGSSVLEIGSAEGDLLASLEPSKGVGVDVSRGMVESGRMRH